MVSLMRDILRSALVAVTPRKKLCAEELAGRCRRDLAEIALQNALGHDLELLQKEEDACRPKRQL